MDPIILVNVATASEKIGFILAIILNIVLAYLIIYKSHPQLGGYKNLMVVYCFFELLYSFTAWISESKFFNTDMAFVSYRKYSGPYREYAPLLLIQFCTCYFILLMILSLHFVYRYFIVTSSRYMYLFEGWNLMGWIVSAVCSGVSGGLMKFLILGESEYAVEHLRGPFMEQLHVKIEDVVFNGPVLYDCRKGLDKCEKEVKIWILLISFILYVIFFLTIMIYFGLKIYKKMDNCCKMSLSTSHLQKQLFWALFFQTAIPFIFMYIPVIVIYIFPMIGVNLGAYSNIMLICFAIYPPLDQLFIIYIIKDYRRAITSKILCCFRQTEVEPKQLQSTSF